MLQLLCTEHTDVQKRFMNLRVSKSTTKHLCLKGKCVNKRSWEGCAFACVFVCVLTCLCLHLQLLTHKSYLWWVSETHTALTFSPHRGMFGVLLDRAPQTSNVGEHRGGDAAVSSDMAAQRVVNVRLLHEV